MIPEVMNSVLLFAIVVLSDIEIEYCAYMSMDGSCSGSVLNGQCTDLCGSMDCSGSGITCSSYKSTIRNAYSAFTDYGECFNLGSDFMVTCGGGDSDNNGDNGSGGNDNGGNDNGGSDNGGSDNGGSDNGGSDNDDDDELAISITTCISTNGLCEQCQESEFDFSMFGGMITSCEQLKTHISNAYGDFEDYDSCFTQSAGGISGSDTIFKCSGGDNGDNGSGGSENDDDDEAASSSSDNTGMIVGIVIGCIVLVAGIATFVFCMKKQNKL